MQGAFYTPPAHRVVRVLAEEKIAEIRERTDAVALIGEYVDLKRAGASFRGLCPFHSEKSPSFYVHPARQFFHCFGCGASGDVIAFVMRLEGRPFPDALRFLAERAGIELPSEDPGRDDEDRRQRRHLERIAAVIEAAAGYYVEQLSTHPLSEIARAELERRGVRPETARQFRLGYAPFGWDGLTRFLREKGHSSADCEAAGLLVPRRSSEGYYDRFRHRLLFPISDATGRIVAFSGRTLALPPGQEPPKEPPAKYVNSPEGPLYRKSSILFGLHEGRVALRREGWALLCEGNFDLVALHQAGFENAVAPLGTAFTAEHVKLLRRFVSRVVFLFDGDAAGRKAVRSAHPLLAAAGLGAQVVALPSGDDPDSYLRRVGPEVLRERIAEAPDMVSFLIDEAAERAAGDPREKAQAIAELGPVLAALDNPIEARLSVERVARRFGVADLDAVKRQLRAGLRAASPNDASRHVHKSSNQAAAPIPQTKESASLPPGECELLGALLDHPPLFATEEGKILAELLTSSDLRAIFETSFRMVDTRGVLDAPGLLAQLTGSPAQRWLEERLAISRYDAKEAANALREGIPVLARQNIERELPRLRNEILKARREGDDARALRLTREREALYLSSKKWMQGTSR